MTTESPPPSVHGAPTEKEDNIVINKINEAEAEARKIIEGAESEAMEMLRQAKIKAQQIAGEPIDVSGISGSVRSNSIKSQIEGINSANMKAIASMKESANKRRGEAADFIVSLVMAADENP